MYQKTIIAGNVGRDPELRYTPSGLGVVQFSVAVSRKTMVNGQAVKETGWFRVTAWDKLAEYAYTYLQKGSKVLVDGRLTFDPATGGPKIWTTNDGNTGASFELVAEAIRCMANWKSGESVPDQNAKAVNPQSPQQNQLDGIPDDQISY